MNIETLIQDNTNAIIGLTEVLIKLQRGWITIEDPSGAIAEMIVTEEPEPLKDPKLDYPTAKALISSLALTHREQIKELNKKYQLSVFAELLVDKNDVTKGVTDQEKLEHYYEDLLALK